MTDTTYPAFEQYQPDTAAFLKTLLQPYHDALTAADTIEALTDWIPLVLPESAEALNTAIIESENVEQAKLTILQTLASVLLDPDNTTATPWEINRNRNEIAVRLFGPSSDTIPVVIINGPNTFQHELTQDLMYGILVGLTGIPGWNITIGNIEVTRERYDPSYNEDQIENTSYAATVDDVEIYFNGVDFVQGVITAAQWTQRDPHTIITKLMELGDDDFENIINF